MLRNRILLAAAAAVTAIGGLTVAVTAFGATGPATSALPGLNPPNMHAPAAAPDVARSDDALSAGGRAIPLRSYSPSW